MCNFKNKLNKFSHFGRQSFFPHGMSRIECAQQEDSEAHCTAVAYCAGLMCSQIMLNGNKIPHIDSPFTLCDLLSYIMNCIEADDVDVTQCERFH